MTTPVDPFPTKSESKIFERFSWLPLAIALVIGAVWVISRFRSQKLQSVIFAVGVVLLLGVELLRWRRSRSRTGQKVDNTVFVDGASSFCVALLYGIGSALIVIPLLYAFAQWLHTHAIFHVNDRLKDLFGGSSIVVIGVLLFVAVDFTYYWAHRLGHTMELFWANHSVHHSSEHYNPSTAVRISFLDEAWDLVLVSLWVLVGFSPAALFVIYGFVMLYQLPLHVSWRGRFPRPIEYVFNTPEHHQAHHARQKLYIDKNFSGIFILWDRIFGTYAEVEKVHPVYGLTIPVGTFRIMPIMFHENVSMIKKMIHAKSVVTAVQYPFRRPYWEPAEK
jgi:sterol desaturase/sphingolipid hydroxylase (fatty acid hydroxylase superfamily)